MSRRPMWLRTLRTAVALAACAPCGAALGQPALAWRDCAAARGLRCATLTVPLDRADPGAGTLSLPVRRASAVGAYRGTLLFLAGGPGQAAIVGSGSLERGLRDEAPAGWEVVVMDQRGTGPTALRCPDLERRANIPDPPGGIGALVAGCAEAIGPPRRHHGTADTVADLEDLRIAMGRDAMTLVGVSYGTLVATWYARTHPTHTAGLVLDSVVDPAGAAALDTEAYAAARRAMGELCAAGRCDGVTRDLGRDVARLEARLAVGPLRGGRVGTGGGVRPAMFGGPSAPTQLFEAFQAGDLSPAARRAFPAAVRMALRGDPALLFRITDVPATTTDPQRFSVGLFLATACGESDLPWSADQATDQRVAAATAAAAALDAAVFAPFARPGADAASVVACAHWPESPVTAPPDLPLPDVPTLLLSGTQDVRTPLETARAVAAGMPRAVALRAAGAGHSVISTRTGCAMSAIREFLDHATVRRSCPAESPRRIAPVPPASVAGVRPVALPGLRGRTIRAATLTLQDAQRAMEFGRVVRGGIRFAGLRGGYGTVALTGAGLRLRLHDYAYLPGARVSGVVLVPLVDLGVGGATIRVDGPAVAPARLRITDHLLTGTVGGRRVTRRR